jgi:hypothetical protein
MIKDSERQLVIGSFSSSAADLAPSLGPDDPLFSFPRLGVFQMQGN